MKKNGTKKASGSARLPEDLKKDLADIATKVGVTQTDIIIECLTAYLPELIERWRLSVRADAAAKQRALDELAAKFPRKANKT